MINRVCFSALAAPAVSGSSKTRPRTPALPNTVPIRIVASIVDSKVAPLFESYGQHQRVDFVMSLMAHMRANRNYSRNAPGACATLGIEAAIARQQHRQWPRALELLEHDQHDRREWNRQQRAGDPPQRAPHRQAEDNDERAEV